MSPSHTPLQPSRRHQYVANHITTAIAEDGGHRHVDGHIDPSDGLQHVNRGTTPTTSATA